MAVVTQYTNNAKVHQNRPAEMLAIALGGASMTIAEKLDYVRSHMKMASMWRTAEAIAASIPSSLVESLTAEMLVIVADALHTAHTAGKAKAERDILAEGAIYSPKHGRMLEIAADETIVSTSTLFQPAVNEILRRIARLLRNWAFDEVDRTALRIGSVVLFSGRWRPRPGGG